MLRPALVDPQHLAVVSLVLSLNEGNNGQTFSVPLLAFVDLYFHMHLISNKFCKSRQSVKEHFKRSDPSSLHSYG